MFLLHCSPDLPEAVPAGTHHYLAAVARRVLTVHAAGGPVEAVLTDDAEVRRLNASFRGRDRSTDVLSFSLREDPDCRSGGGSVLSPAEFDAPAGEIYISLPQATAQATERGVTVEAELTRLLVHGLLHLAGFDHQTAAELEAMERETERFVCPSPCPARQR